MTAVAVLGTGAMAPGIAVAFAAVGHPVVVWGRNADGVDAAVVAAGAMARLLEEEGLAGSADEMAARSTVPATSRGSRGRTSSSRPWRDPRGQARGARGRRGRRRARRAARDEQVRPAGDRHRSAAATPRTGRGAALLEPRASDADREVAGGEHAAAERVAEAADLVRAIGKVPVVLHHEVLGFLGTRMQQAVVREAIALLDAGVASAADIDLAVRTSFGVRFPAIGPLESADISGLDVIAAIHAYLLPDLDRSTTLQPALVDCIGRGDLGVKSGRGFHEGPGDRAAEVIARRDRELVRRARLVAADGLEGGVAR